MSNSLVEFGTFYMWLFSDMVIVCAEIIILCGVIFNKCIHAIYLLHPMYLHVLLRLFNDYDIPFEWRHVMELTLLLYFL